MPEPTTPAPPPSPPSCAGCVGCGGPDCIERPEAVEIPLDVARTLHAMLGGLLGEHNEPPARDMMREAIAGALRTAAYYCDGDCGLDEPACNAAHAIRVDAWAHGVVSDISGPVDALTTAVLAVRDGEVERLRERVATMGDALTAAGDMYRTQRTRAEEAEARIAAALALHQPRGVVGAAEHGEPADCSTCGPNTYPCPTVTALTAPHGPGGHDGGGK